MSEQVSRPEGDSLKGPGFQVLPWMSPCLLCKLARLCLEVCGSHDEHGALHGRRGNI